MVGTSKCEKSAVLYANLARLTKNTAGWIGQSTDLPTIMKLRTLLCIFIWIMQKYENASQDVPVI